MLRVTRGPNYTLFFNQESRAKNSLSSLPVHKIWQKQRWATKQTAWRCCYPLVLFLEASLWCCSSDCKMVSVAWQVKSSALSQTTESAVFWENVMLTLPQRRFSFYTGGLNQICAATTLSATLTSPLTSQHMQYNMFKCTSALQELEV